MNLRVEKVCRLGLKNSYHDKLQLKAGNLLTERY